MDLPVYCIIGDRPVKGVSTADGGMDVLAFDWDTGGFVRDMGHLHTLVHPQDEDADFVDEATFEARVSALRGERRHIATADEHIFLRHHDRFDRVLVYDAVTGDYREVLRTMKPASASLWTGFYVVVGEQAVGVFATAAGPVFFCNEARTRLVRGQTAARVERDSGPDVNTFRLTVDGREIAALEYTPPPAGFDPYEDDDGTMSDFFLWLADGLNRGGLFTAYAVDGAAARWNESAAS
jgi:hypothetical protein